MPEDAVCPDCMMENVIIQTAPLRPPRMHCTNCQWDSLNGSSEEELLPDGGRKGATTTPADLDECWCCDGLHDSPGTLCPDCKDAGCNRFTDKCESDHKPVLADGGQADGHGQAIEQVSDDALDEASFELRQVASHIGWTDEEREDEYLAICDHLQNLKTASVERGKELAMSWRSWTLKVQVVKEGNADA